MGLISGVKSFLVDKFVIPLTNESVFYNPFNTAVYAVFFALASIYLGPPILDKFDIELDREFFIGITPYIFLGGSLRVIEDINLLDTFLLVTPFIYVVMFVFTVSALAFSRLLERLTEYNYHIYFSSIGIFSLISLTVLYNFKNLFLLPKIALIFSFIASILFVLIKAFKPSLWSFSFIIPVLAHYFDATTSFVALSAGAVEKHVLASAFVKFLGPVGMFVMKSLVIIPVVYYIFENFEGQERRYYLFIIALLGIGLGTRNMLTMIV